MVSEWLTSRYDYLTTTQVRCKACGAEMDVRAGRAKRHYEKMHEEAAPVVDEPDPPGKPVVRGSREWAIEEVLKIAAAKNATHEQKLKALDLLKEYEQYGSKRLDDQKESEESLAQWDRVLAKASGLKTAEAKLLKDPAVRERLRMALDAP